MTSALDFLKKTFFIFSVMSKDLVYNKTGVINDPLGRPTVQADSGFQFILEIWDYDRPRESI